MIDLLDVGKVVNHLRRLRVVIFEHPPSASVSNLFITSRGFMFSSFGWRIQTPTIERLARTACGRQPDPHRRQ